MNTTKYTVALKIISAYFDKLRNDDVYVPEIVSKSLDDCKEFIFNYEGDEKINELAENLRKIKS